MAVANYNSCNRNCLNELHTHSNKTSTPTIKCILCGKFLLRSELLSLTLLVNYFLMLSHCLNLLLLFNEYVNRGAYTNYILMFLLTSCYFCRWLIKILLLWLIFTLHSYDVDVDMHMCECVRFLPLFFSKFGNFICLLFFFESIIGNNHNLTSKL